MMVFMKLRLDLLSGDAREGVHVFEVWSTTVSTSFDADNSATHGPSLQTLSTKSAPVYGGMLRLLQAPMAAMIQSVLLIELRPTYKPSHSFRSVTFATVVFVVVLTSNPALNVTQPNSPNDDNVIIEFPAGARAVFAMLTSVQMLHCAVVCYRFVRLSIPSQDHEESLSLDDLDVSGWGP